MLSRSSVISIVLFFCVIFLDRFTKNWAHNILVDAPSIEIASWGGIDLYLTFAKNQGAAWGILSSSPILLLAIRSFCILLLGYLILQKNRPFLTRLSLLLIFSGAFSNLYDTLIYGSVIDMIHLVFWGYQYPIFNIADCAISTGAVLFLVASYIEKKE